MTGQYYSDHAAKKLLEGPYLGYEITGGGNNTEIILRGLDQMMRKEGLFSMVYQHEFLIVAGPDAGEVLEKIELVPLIPPGPVYEAHRLVTLETLNDCQEAIFSIKKLISVPPYVLHPKELFCPECGTQHIDHMEQDGVDWGRMPHRTHLCHGCGKTFRPFEFYTVGTGKECPVCPLLQKS